MTNEFVEVGFDFCREFFYCSDGRRIAFWTPNSLSSATGVASSTVGGTFDFCASPSPLDSLVRFPMRNKTPLLTRNFFFVERQPWPIGRNRRNETSIRMRKTKRATHRRKKKKRWRTIGERNIVAVVRKWSIRVAGSSSIFYSRFFWSTLFGVGVLVRSFLAGDYSTARNFVPNWFDAHPSENWVKIRWKQWADVVYLNQNEISARNGI